MLLFVCVYECVCLYLVQKQLPFTECAHACILCHTAGSLLGFTKALTDIGSFLSGGRERGKKKGSSGIEEERAVKQQQQAQRDHERVSKWTKVRKHRGL